jgi:hypothetical protein
MPSTSPWESNERETFRYVFDEDADGYSRSRPVAPVHVFDDLVEIAGLQPGASLVEIGPGPARRRVCWPSAACASWRSRSAHAWPSVPARISRPPPTSRS